MAKRFDSHQWNQGQDAFDQSVVTEAQLAAAAATLPPVKCVCPTCNGGKVVIDPLGRKLSNGTPIVVNCQECEGTGFFLRELDSREEHYYILHLLQRYQLR